jgi:hypothetical protein
MYYYVEKYQRNIRILNNVIINHEDMPIKYNKRISREGIIIL